ncbi:MAG: hypothetical protein U0235_02825 [Polyangiaceae bacterium]
MFNPLRIAFHEYAAIGRDLRRAASFREARVGISGTTGVRRASPRTSARARAAPGPDPALGLSSTEVLARRCAHGWPRKPCWRAGSWRARPRAPPRGSRCRSSSPCGAIAIPRARRPTRGRDASASARLHRHGCPPSRNAARSTCSRRYADPRARARSWCGRRARARIAGRELVPGDIVILSEGDRVPADCAVPRASHLAVEQESLLSGESVPVTKSVWDGERLIVRRCAKISSTLARYVVAGASAAEAGLARPPVPRSATAAPRPGARGSGATLLHSARSSGAMGGGRPCLAANKQQAVDLERDAGSSATTCSMAILPTELPVVVVDIPRARGVSPSRASASSRAVSSRSKRWARITALCVDKTGTRPKTA